MGGDCQVLAISTAIPHQFATATFEMTATNLATFGTFLAVCASIPRRFTAGVRPDFWTRRSTLTGLQLRILTTILTNLNNRILFKKNVAGNMTYNTAA